MKEFALLMSPQMVHALLCNRKSQTRRLRGLEEINRRPGDWEYDGPDKDGNHRFYDMTRARYTTVRVNSTHPGDVLCVRETWCTLAQWDKWKPSDLPSSNLTVPIHYLADSPKPAGFGKTRPGIFLPKWGWRIKRPIIAQERIERVKSITWQDSLDEGVTINLYDGKLAIRLTGKCPPADYWKPGDSDEQFIIAHFASLWDTVHGPGAWSKNDWVRVITFSASQ